MNKQIGTHKESSTFTKKANNHEGKNIIVHLV